MNLMCKIEERKEIPEKWREHVLVSIFKEKEDVQECRNYQEIKLLSHTMKIWEKTMDERLRLEVEVSRGQFGCMAERGTTN